VLSNISAAEVGGICPAGHGRAAVIGRRRTVLKKGARITGAERSKLANDLKKQYDKGLSIRELAETNGRSYGFVHRVLSESGVELRGRGGSSRARTKVS
jgi:hypothetical protein